MANQIVSHAGRDRRDMGGFEAFGDQVDAQRKLPQRDRDCGDRRRRGPLSHEAEQRGDRWGASTGQLKYPRYF